MIESKDKLISEEEWIKHLNSLKTKQKTTKSELKKQIPIPSLDGVLLRAVSTKIDSSGNIIEIKAHVYSQ